VCGPPVPVAEHAHGGGDKKRTDQSGIEEDCDRKTQSDLFHDDDVGGCEGEADRDDDRGRRGDDPASGDEPGCDGIAIPSARASGLADPGQHEYLVVHRDPEQRREKHDRQRWVDIPGGIDPQRPVQVSVLEHPHKHAERSGDRQ